MSYPDASFPKDQRRHPQLRRGLVYSLDPTRCKVRVIFPEYHNMLSYWLRVKVQHSQYDKQYWMPDIGELVLVETDERGESGVVPGTWYNQKDVPCVASADKTHYHYKDGSWSEYDRGYSTYQGFFSLGTQGILQSPSGDTITITGGPQPVLNIPQADNAPPLANSILQQWGENINLTIIPGSVTFSVGSSIIKITETAITLSVGSVVISITQSGITLSIASSVIALTSGSITISVGGSVIEIDPAQINMSALVGALVLGAVGFVGSGAGSLLQLLGLPNFQPPLPFAVTTTIADVAADLGQVSSTPEGPIIPTVSASPASPASPATAGTPPVHPSPGYAIGTPGQAMIYQDQQGGGGQPFSPALTPTQAGQLANLAAATTLNASTLPAATVGSVYTSEGLTVKVKAIAGSQYTYQISQVAITVGIGSPSQNPLISGLGTSASPYVLTITSTQAPTTYGAFWGYISLQMFNALNTPNEIVVL